MSRLLLCGLALLCLAALLSAQDAAPVRIEFDKSNPVETKDRDAAGRHTVQVTVRFTVTVDEGKLDERASPLQIQVEEDGHVVATSDIRIVPSQDLSLVLAMDVSGSMNDFGRIDQARAAALTFLDLLPPRADCGLVLFDHLIMTPALRPQRERSELRERINSVRPRGGTAYLDAAQTSFQLLSSSNSANKRALVIMTDGIDTHSKATLDQVIKEAQTKKVQVFTIGIGTPGKKAGVTTVLVLDHSGSMAPPASSEESTPKIVALQKAASRFLEIMPQTARCMLVPFSSTVDFSIPAEFTSDPTFLLDQVRRFVPKEEADSRPAQPGSWIVPEGETAFFDATYEAIALLETQSSSGKRSVVAMTDGIDNISRRRVREVIDRARDAKIPLQVLGLGRPGELDEKTMQMMADETGGKYYPIRDAKALEDIFERLSVKIHDEGIDEASLRRLAGETEGRYFHVKNISDLRFIMEDVGRSIVRKPYEVTFTSRRPVHDGTTRGIVLKLLRRGVAVEELKASVQVSGVVPAEMNVWVFLVLLAGLGTLILLPAAWKARQA